jgi:1-pyrroline-5-carboxylate dehydrogenase
MMSNRKEFQNEPLTDFSRPENREAQEKALAEVRAKLGKTYPLLIAGREVEAPETFTSINPARKDEVIGVFQKATPELGIQALEEAWKAFEEWKRVPAEKRAKVGFKAADIMRRRRFEVNAWMILETGKSFAEADGDTAEAIDFLDFYALEALRYAGPQPITPIPGEKNQMVYIPLGVGVAIPPWNFPMAILAGMTSAAWLAGNTVVLKPASTSPMMGWIYMEIVKEAGLPDGVVNYVSGPGGRVGNALVEHPKTRFVTFTGSKEVGLGINAKAAQTAEGQIWIKRVVAEMGGKDSIIVDREADLDQAVDGVLASAFGYQGQKCSACSRAIVDETLYDQFITKLVGKVSKIRQGDPTDIDNYMGPVIDKAAFDKIMSYVDTGKSEGGLVAGGEGDDSEGYFIQPTVFKDIDPMARLSQEEIFGPVLAVIKARGWDHALEIGNNTEFGLTGAVYTKNMAKAEQALVDFHVGNLYINRKCTGAMVGGHPFGGFNMSGTDSKAGGRDYLLLFLQAKSTSTKVT